MPSTSSCVLLILVNIPGPCENIEESDGFSGSKSRASPISRIIATTVYSSHVPVFNGLCPSNDPLTGKIQTLSPASKSFPNWIFNDSDITNTLSMSMGSIYSRSSSIDSPSLTESSINGSAPNFRSSGFR
ncbi:hypothetical protein ES703_55846 [subsurface metagenome]